MAEKGYFSDDVVDHFETVSSYNWNDASGHEYVKLEAPTSDPGDPAIVELYIDGGSVEVKHETNVDFEPLFDILDREYPPSRDDEVWAGDSTGFDRRSFKLGFDDDLYAFQFYRNREPEFDINWVNETHRNGKMYSTPFAFELKCYDNLGLSLDRDSSDPVKDILPVMLRADMPEESQAKLVKDILPFFDYGIEAEKGTSLAHYMGEDEIKELIHTAANRYDPHR